MSMYGSRRAFVVLAVGVSLLGTSEMARAGTGDVDRSFGDGGAVVINGPEIDRHVMHGGLVSSIDAVGSLITVGSSSYSPQGSDEFTVLTKLRPDGSADETFSGDGTRRWRFSREGEYPQTQTTAVMALTGGGAQIAGYFEDGGVSQGPHTQYSTRFLANGKLDRTYGRNGVFRPGGERSVASLRPDGSADWCRTPEELGDLTVRRYLADGSPDETFSGDGIARVDLVQPSYTFRGIKSCTRMPSGKIVALFYGTDPAAQDSAVTLIAHFTASGRLNRQFGDNGVAVANPPDPYDVDGQRITFTPALGDVVGDRSQLYISGTVCEYPSSACYPAVYATRRDGRPDDSYGGGDALASLDEPPLRGTTDGGRPRVSGAALSADGSLTVAGSLSSSFVGQHPYIARLTPNGEVDRDFGDNGVTIDVPPGTDEVSQVTRDARDRIVVSSYGDAIGYNAYAVTRFQP